MSVFIAIPEPTSRDAEYNRRSLPLYLSALRASGATPILIPLHESQQRVARLLSSVQGVLLPGSKYDVDPERYGEARIAACGESDAKRAAVDELLLQDAFGMHKPVLGICHGAQALNVWLNGALIQDLSSEVNHRPGREVEKAHPVRVLEGSRLAGMLPRSQKGDPRVNSSHHQAIATVGDHLCVSAYSTGDSVVEVVELESFDHFVVGVQWHPERSFMQSAFSRSIFAGFVQAAMIWEPRLVEEPIEV